MPEEVGNKRRGQVERGASVGEGGGGWGGVRWGRRRGGERGVEGAECRERERVMGG